MDHKTALHLAKTACPSIAYRIRKEIFHEDTSSPEMKALQDKILSDPEVVRIFALQKEDGWLGGSFHGTDEPESAIRYLMEKGVEPSHPVVQGALRAIIARGNDFDRGCMERVGKPLDKWHLGGSKLMKAWVFACAGEENHDFVRGMVNEALDVFRYEAGVTRAEDIYEMYKGIPVFRSGVMWPSLYHLRLLAVTQGWRTAENASLLAQAIGRMAELSPIPPIRLLHKHQVIAPASIDINIFQKDMDALPDKEWMLWFHLTELIARLGAATRVETIRKQMEQVRQMVSSSGGLFTKKLRHYYFTKWTQYTGLRLEADWASADRRTYDLTFRWLMIEAYSSLD